MKRYETLHENTELTRRFFLGTGLAAACLSPRVIAAVQEKKQKTPKGGVQPDPYFTSQQNFGDVSRGNPLPHTLDDEKKREVGLTRDTWALEVISDPEKPARLGKEFTKAKNNAITFADLIELGEKHAVRFPKVMTCLNMGCPLGMGLWEGVPLREVLWLTKPRENLRRVFYYGYHNNDPKQMFRSSLPVGRILEDPVDLPPVILCYKLNGEWLNSERGGPVRVVVPEAYGFKSIKWLSHVVLSNIAHANDTYAEQNNDVDSPLKTFAATISIPAEAKPGEAIAVSGYAQVGISGLKKVQVSMESNDTPIDETDPHFTKLNWMDATLLSAPREWSGLAGGKIPPGTIGFDRTGIPRNWPMRLTNAHWEVTIPGQSGGNYTIRCRTIDDQGNAQPMPRPFRKSGFAMIESVPIRIKP